jgi:hypothetical protein
MKKKKGGDKSDVGLKHDESVDVATCVATLAPPEPKAVLSLTCYKNRDKCISMLQLTDTRD